MVPQFHRSMNAEQITHKHWILVVEDHESSRLVIQSLLERRNYNVVTASNVQEALALASHYKFSLLISDIGLPDGTGYELITALQEKFGLPGIATSGYGSADALAQSKAAGFAFHLVKPLNVHQLDAVLLKMFPP